MSNSAALEQSDSGLPTPRRWLAMAAVSLGTTVAAIDIALPAIALPSISRELKVSPANVVQLVTVSQLILVMTLLPVSALGERLGYRRIYLAGVTCFCVGGILCFLAQSFTALLVARAVQAIGTSATISVSTAMLRGIFPDHRLGQGLAIHSVVVSCANAAAPAIGGAILSLADWSYIFIAGLPLAAVSLLLGRNLPAPVRRHLPYDWVAALLCAITFGCMIAGLEVLVHKGVSMVSLGLLLLATVSGYVFVRKEVGQSDPILPVDLLRQPSIGLAVLGSFMAFIVSMLMIVTMPFRLSADYGFSAGEIGTLIAPWPFMIMLSAPLAAYLSDRIEPSILGTFGMVVSTIGMITLFFIPDNPSWFDVAWRMALGGVGFGFFTSPNARFIIKAAPRERAAAAGGLISTNRLTGQVIGASLAAGMLTFGSAGSLIAPVIGAVLCFAAAASGFVRVRADLAKA